MANSFYDRGEQRAAKVNQLFTRIAPRYDLINDLQSFGLHRHWKRRLISMARVQPGDRALDVCCGTGDLAFALARQGALVIGLDFSEPMLAVAEERKSKGQSPTPINREQESKVQGPGSSAQQPKFMLGDAQRLPFDAASFDVVTVGYGLRNLSSWEAGLREMIRVARPGARLLILDFGKPSNRAWRAAYFAYLRLFVPILGRIFCGSARAYAYILESLQDYPAQSGLEIKMRELGLAEVHVVNLLGGVMGINYGEKPL
jgi:demethylmenaquinone methyltransferase / 2-methoxy-6-polyprenyl-1,4-benzoquinol methylase